MTNDQFAEFMTLLRAIESRLAMLEQQAAFQLRQFEALRGVLKDIFVDTSKPLAPIL